MAPHEEPFDPLADDDVVEFKKKARQLFVPSVPIETRDQLKGRERHLDRTLEALHDPGRSVFIYGERGVGKRSLALTAAHAFHNSESAAIHVSCHPSTTMGHLLTQIARRMLSQPVIASRKKSVTEAKANLTVVELLHRVEKDPDAVPAHVDLNDAVDLLNELLPKRDEYPFVIVVDEVDLIASPDVRADISFLIKQLGDHKSRVKFIFVGIAETIDKLIAHHGSAGRYLATIKVEQLDPLVLRGIVVDGFEALGCSLWPPLAMRVACLSDGFAHYTHLVALKLALRYADLHRRPKSIDSTLLERALSDAIEDAEVLMKTAYDNAVRKYDQEYERVLWAVADHWETERSTRDMYESYCRICKDMGREPKERKEFSAFLNALKAPSHGQTLVSKRRSWFKFRETMLRGYCRMVGLSKGVEVGLDYLQSRESQPKRASVRVLPLDSDGDSNETPPNDE